MNSKISELENLRNELIAKRETMEISYKAQAEFEKKVMGIKKK